jgi:hypothetical protein
MRALYNRFDGVFVLNREHRDWLTGHEMQLPDERVFLIEHQAEPIMRQFVSDLGLDYPEQVYVEATVA